MVELGETLIRRGFGPGKCRKTGNFDFGEWFVHLAFAIPYVEERGIRGAQKKLRKDRSRSFCRLFIVLSLPYLFNPLACHADDTMVGQSFHECREPVLPVEEIFSPARIRIPASPSGYIAHALGGIDGWAYSNSREGFRQAYAAGFRIFEVDLVLLADGAVLAAHDQHEHLYGLDRIFSELTREDMAGVKWREHYTPMFVETLLQELAAKPDAWLILDTKIHHLEILQAVIAVGQVVAPCALPRLIPHISGHRKALQTIRNLYPFSTYMLALYRSSFDNEHVLDFLAKEPTVRAVMMWHDKRYTAAFAQATTTLGVATYVHSLRDPQTIAAFRAAGVGVYSDAPYPHPSVMLDRTAYRPSQPVTVQHTVQGPVVYEWQWSTRPDSGWRPVHNYTARHVPRNPGLWLRCLVIGEDGQEYIAKPIPGL